MYVKIMYFLLSLVVICTPGNFLLEASHCELYIVMPYISIDTFALEPGTQLWYTKIVCLILPGLAFMVY